MSPFSSSSSNALFPDPIARELDTGENVLWSGRPDPARMFRKSIPLALFSIPMTGFMVFWIWMASTGFRSMLAAGQTPSLPMILFPLFGLFGLLLVGLMALSPWIESAKARLTFYALTDRRALIVVDGKMKSVQSVLPAEFALKRRDLARGGDVILKREVKGSGKNRKVTEYGFYGIETHHEVERMARELAQSPR